MLPEEKKEKEFIEKLGKRIKALRLSKELRQNEVAYRCNFDKSSS
ncbi:MAG TPA: XRE family transcriptional regulator, partial [Flavobacteriaceae bacterium]|nr:XRE family transcriptional regulator [Flavobacteriaceae bacterium]